MDADKPIVVIGGTRGTGLLIAQRLQGQGVPVRVLARNPLTARARLGPMFAITPGDITRPETLPPALAGTSHVIFTAGCRSGRPATERRVRATEFGGVVNTLVAARQTGFGGRFLYMTSSSVTSRSLATTLLNLYKGNTLVWRERAEHEIRASGLEYTIIRAGVLLNRPGGRRALLVTQRPLPLSFRNTIARADVADVFVAALRHPRAVRATFDVVWSDGPPRNPLSVLLDRLQADEAPGFVPPDLNARIHD
jgi:uncharacterized protein YbjT (DUF2867 family)